MTKPAPVALKRPIADDVEWVIRDLVRSIRDEGSAFEAEDGTLTLHPAISHLPDLLRCLPIGRVTERRDFQP